MLRPILVALLLTALLAMPALADGPREERMERRQEAMQRWNQLNATQQDRGLALAEAHGLFARFSYDAATGQAAGVFLKFKVQPSAGSLQDVRVRANGTLPLTPLLASVTPDSFTLQDGPTVHGATLQMDGAGLDLMAHNNPNGALTWRAGAATTLTFTLAPGLHAFFPDPADTHEVRFSAGLTHAHIASDSATPIQIGNGNTTVTVALAAGDGAMVRLHPAKDALGSGLHDLLKAFERHRLGATLRIADAGGAAAEDGDGADVNATTRSIERGHVVLDIGSAQHEGRVLFLTLANGTLDPARLDQVAATLDGAGMTNVHTTANVLAATEPSFALVPSGDGQSVTLAVYVPHFSSYALAVTQPLATGGGASSSPSGAASGGASTSRSTPGLEAGALLALGLAVALRRRA